jgi:hypothetical protein
MALPMMNTPTYNMVVPSSGASVKFRPFLVKEEKALLIAQQSEDPRIMVDTLKNVINECVLDTIDASKLATFDLEYMFTQIRAKSVGENIELVFPCDEDHGEQNEKARVKVTIDLTTIEVKKNPDHTNQVSLFGDVGVVMKYPNIDVIRKLESLDADDLDVIFEVVAASIDYIYQGDEVFHSKEQRPDDIMKFLNNLTTEQFSKLQQFFVTMPRLYKEVEYNCPVCGKHHKKLLEGMQSFF